MKGCYEQFTVSVLREGSKGNKRITMPVAAANRMRSAGTLFPGWVRLTVPGFQAIFVEARFPPSRPSVAITLPEWAFSGLKFGDEIDVTVEDARPYRAVEADSDEWFHYVTDRYFPRYQGDTLVLHSRHEPPFKLRRYIEKAAWRVLGFFQAEGTKGATVIDWNVVNTNPALLKFISDQMVDMGISKERQYMEVLQGPGETAAEANAVFEPVRVSISTTRPRVKERGGHAAILHGRSSRPLLLLMKKLLERVFQEGFEFPSRTAAHEYTLGWLDGDGTITVVGSTAVELRLAGLAEEHRILQQALGTAFGWGHDKGSGWKDNKQGTHITLRAQEMLDLLDAHAFQFSMSHIRLLCAFDKRTQRLREIHAGDPDRRGAFVRWGLLNHDGMLTDLGEKICRGHARWKTEIEKATRLKTTSPHLFGLKGVSNPL